MFASAAQKFDRSAPVIRYEGSGVDEVFDSRIGQEGKLVRGNFLFSKRRILPPGNHSVRNHDSRAADAAVMPEVRFCREQRIVRFFVGLRRVEKFSHDERRVSDVGNVSTVYPQI